jgi:hypothetical protein
MVMSALHLKADMCGAIPHVCFGPEADTAFRFDGMLAAIVPVPVRTATVGAVNVSAQAFSVGEGSARPISNCSAKGHVRFTPHSGHSLVRVAWP